MLDDLERGIVHALHLDGRAPFSRIAEVLGVSTQTVARRYRRLRAEAGLRVVGLADRDRSGDTQWVVRIGTTPGSSQALAHALARRSDTSWVKLTSAGTEVFAVVHAPHAEQPVLLGEVLRRSGVTAVSAQCVLHTYLGGPTAWHGRLAALDDRQQQELRPVLPEPSGRSAAGRSAAFTPADRALVDALGHDGRASYAQLATATGWSQATVARRLAELRARKAVFFDVEVDTAAYGVTTRALLWMAVPPAHLDRVGSALAGHEELAVVVATTGTTNLLAQALCPDPTALHHYLTRRLGALGEIRALESAPVLRTLKAAGHLGRPVRAPRP
ncbi:AsnC family transcriptional regulator [Streptomyces sp. NPDC049555]|uniref:Lrp/AsnC family transcriptional regulator n=1 Tax=Streptomyces sp. NPDC049555 TaxID=3154930 RepID=UPI0034187378